MGSFIVSGVYLDCFIGTHVTEYAVFTHVTVPCAALGPIGVYIRLLNVVQSWGSF